MDCYCDNESPEFFWRKDRKAKIEHRCCECGSTIHKAEKYEYACGKWDGAVSAYKTCERCLDFRRWFEKNRPCVCWAFRSMYEIVHEQIQEEADTLMTEAPGFMFECGRRYIAIRKRARADKAQRKARNENQQRAPP